MIKTHLSVMCDHCGFVVEMQADNRPGVESHKIPPGWGMKYDHGLALHYCPACKMLPKSVRSLEETP